jgi:hypothetical protein
MKLCHYSEILQLAAELAGLAYSHDVGASGLSVDEERGLRTSVNTQLAMLWPKGKWPGITRVEQRSFRAFWSSGTTYSNGATAAVEVFDPETDKYFQSLRAANLNHPPTIDDEENSAWWAECATSYSGEDWAALTEYALGTIVYRPELARYYQCHTAHTSGASFGGSTYWGILTEFDAYISYTQTGETEIWEQGEIILWALNPRATTRATIIPSFLSENGIQPLGNYPARPWVEYKIRVPNLFGEVFDAATIYAAGDQVQFETTSGRVAFINFYTCLDTTVAGESPSTDPELWARVELPDVFKHYLGAKGAVAWLAGEGDGRLTIAEAAAAEAESNLNDLLYRVQGQVPRTQVMSQN